ncbi:MAG: hypothetical protein WBA34_04755 [Candidatus Deferrimicrobiaceae bacterium]
MNIEKHNAIWFFTEFAEGFHAVSDGMNRHMPAGNMSLQRPADQGLVVHDKDIYGMHEKIHGNLYAKEETRTVTRKLVSYPGYCKGTREWRNIS